MRLRDAAVENARAPPANEGYVDVLPETESEWSDPLFFGFIDLTNPTGYGTFGLTWPLHDLVTIIHCPSIFDSTR